MPSDSRKIAAGLVQYGFPTGIQDPVLWIEAGHRCCMRTGSFDPREAQRIYCRLAGITEWPGKAWRSIKSGLRDAAQAIIPYLSTIVVLEGPAFIQAVGNILAKEPVDEEAKKKIMDRVKTMATTDAVRWIADQAGASRKDTQKLLRELERSKMAFKVAVLSADELESYYTGDELPLYCSKCQNSDYTPTGKIGCVVADDSTIREFLDRFQTDELMFPGEKCPGFKEEAPINTAETDLAAGGVERILQGRSHRPRVADTSSASMIKEVPLEPVPDFDRIPSSPVHRDLSQLEDDPLFDLLSQAVDEFLKNPTGENGGTYREIIQGIIRQLRKRDRSSIAQDKDYYRMEWADA